MSERTVCIVSSDDVYILYDIGGSYNYDSSQHGIRMDLAVINDGQQFNVSILIRLDLV